MRHELSLVIAEDREDEERLRGVPLRVDEKVREAGTPLAPGYGRDPNLIRPSRPWPLTLDWHQRDLIAGLSDVFIPGSPEHPAPSEVGIAEFFDEWISAPYRTQQRHRPVILAGLSHVDPRAIDRFSVEFLELESQQQVSLVEEMAESWPVPEFFGTFRELVVGGYFTSTAGSELIGYKGNVALSTYPGLPQAALKQIEEELRRLGL